MNIYDMLINRAFNKNGGGGGGGGVFKSANVTIIPSPGTGSDFGIYDPGYSEKPWGFHCCFIQDGQIVGGCPNTVPEETTFTLYYTGNSAEVYPSTRYESSTGAVTWNPETNILTITGDCTITGYIDD